MSIVSIKFGGTGNNAGTAVNISASSNSTLTTLSALSLPGSQVTGNITGNAVNITATSNSTLTTLTALSLPYSQVTGAPAAITALTGDGTASGPGSAAFTLSTVNTNVGTFASVTVNGKGLVTAAANLSGDATTSGSALTLSTVNSNTGTFGSASSIPVITVNGKGLITAVSTVTPTAASAFNIKSESSTYSAVINDYVLASGASFTITLPTAVGVSGQLIAIQHNGTSLTQLYTLNTTSSQTIGGIASGSYVLYTNGETLSLVSDGANWQIQSHKTLTTPASYTPTYVAFGTVVTQNVMWSREGSCMKILGYFVSPNQSAATCSLSLPGGMSVSNSLTSIGGSLLYNMGIMTAAANGATSLVSLSAGGQTTLNFSVYNTAGVDPAVAQTGTSILGGTSVNVQFGVLSIPIQGWQP